MDFKSFPCKTLTGSDDAGSFEAIVAVFGNVDEGGDRIERGAFKRTLKERGLPPIVWSHDWGTPPIGVVTEAVENNEGLRIKGRLFVAADEDHQLARQVYTAMKAADGNGNAPLREFSFGYAVKDSSTVTEDGEDVRVLKDIDLFEVGPTLVGMNPATRLIGVKSLAEAVAAMTHTPDVTTPDVTPPSPADEPDEESTDDKPDPNPTEVGEADPTEVGEAELARIGALLLARPNHIQEIT